MTHATHRARRHPTVALGLGCDRGCSLDTLRQAVEAALAQAGAGWAGLQALAAEQGWALRFHPPEVLAAVPVPNPSETVRRYTGTPSVSEAAALLAAGWPGPPTPALLLEKHKHCGPDGRNATVSVALMNPNPHA